MKCLVLKMTLFVGVLLLISTAFLRFEPLFYNNDEYPMWRSTIDYISRTHKAENIILGDSRAVAGFVPDVLGDNFYNLAVGGGSPIDYYYILKQYLKNNHVKILILSIAPYHLEMSEVFCERTLMYNLLTTEEINEVFSKSLEMNENIMDMSYDDYFIGKDLHIKSKFDYYRDYFKALLITYKCFYFYIPEIQNCLFDFRYRNNIKIYDDIRKRKGNYDFGTHDKAIGENQEARRMTGFENSKVLDYYLNKLFALAKQHNIKVYYIVAPFNETSYAKLNKYNNKYVLGYMNYMNSLKQKYDNVYWNENICCYGNDFFGDQSHLNSKGQRKFSNSVKAFLQNKQ